MRNDHELNKGAHANGDSVHVLCGQYSCNTIILVSIQSPVFLGSTMLHPELLIYFSTFSLARNTFELGIHCLTRCNRYTYTFFCRAFQCTKV